MQVKEVDEQLFARILMHRRSASVTRFHTHPTLKPNTNGYHTFGMITLYFLLVNPDRWNAFMIKAIHDHDMSEQFLGDIPAHVKWRFPELRQQVAVAEEQINKENRWRTGLGLHEGSVLAFLDTLDYMLYSLEERRMGNQYMDEVLVRGFANLRTQNFKALSHYIKPEVVDAIINIFQLEYSVAGGCIFGNQIPKWGSHAQDVCREDSK